MTAKRTAWIALAFAAVIAGVTSYSHALVVVQAADGRPWWSYGQPALTDLVVLGASSAILDRLRAGGRVPPLPLVSLVAAVGMTMTFNLAVSDPAAVPKWVVNGWTAVAFMAALESALGIARRHKAEPEPADVPAGPPDIQADMVWLLGRHSQRKVAEVTGAPRSRIAKLAAPPRPVTVSLNGDGSHAS